MGDILESVCGPYQGVQERPQNTDSISTSEQLKYLPENAPRNTAGLFSFMAIFDKLIKSTTSTCLDCTRSGNPSSSPSGSLYPNLEEQTGCLSVLLGATRSQQQGLSFSAMSLYKSSGKQRIIFTEDPVAPRREPSSRSSSPAGEVSAKSEKPRRPTGKVGLFVYAKIKK